MQHDSSYSNFIEDLAVQVKMENIWSNTCGSWQNCNEATIKTFLTQCVEHNLDPQFCMSWVEHFKNEIPNWVSVSTASLGWMHHHTSNGSAISGTDEFLS